MICKATSVALLATLLIPFAAHANDIGGTAADPDDNQEFQEVPQTTASFVIDGDLSDWEFNTPIVDPLIGIPKIGRDERADVDEPSEYVVHEALSGSWSGPEDQSSTTQFYWKTGSEDELEDGLYIGVVVTDEYHENAANSGWNGDSMQMMVTLYDAEFEEHDEVEFALYNFALGGTDDDLDLEDPNIIADFEKPFPFLTETGEYVSVGIGRDADAGETYYEIHMQPDATGLFPEDLVEGANIGIGWAINDGDVDVPGQGGWVGLGAHAIVFGKTPSEAAVLTLAGEFVGPTCDPGTQGDFDGNGMVEFADFLILSENFGSDVAGHADGDVDCNGTVEFADFLVLSENFGSAVGATSSVPEPSTAMLLGLSLLLLTGRRRRLLS